jgi:hypothetical protein
LLAVANLADFIAGGEQHAGRYLADDRLVVHHQDEVLRVQIQRWAQESSWLK